MNDALRRAVLELYAEVDREVAAAAPHRWVPAEGEEALLGLFLLEKAGYEIRYEAANRPTWLPLPLRGLSALADRLTA